MEGVCRGWLGVVAAVFRKKLTCKKLSTEVWTSHVWIEALVAAICRPLKYHKDFNQDFSNLLADTVPSYNQILIVGDFNIHVCWPSDPLTRDFLSLIDSFSLARFVSGPTPETGSHVGSRVAVFSDRCPGVFGIVSSYHIVVLCLNPLHLNHFLF